MKKIKLLIALIPVFLFSCSTENKKQDCIKQFNIFKSTTPSPDVMEGELIIENDTIKNMIKDKSYSKVYYQGYGVKTIKYGFGIMVVYLDTIKKTYQTAQEYILSWDKSQTQIDSIFKDFKKEVIFVIEDKNGKAYKIKNHCY